MKNLRTIILSAMVAGVLIVPAVSATADTKDGKGYSHFRKTIITTNGMAIMGDGTATTDEDGIIVDDMTGIIIGVMFVMTTVAIIISRRFDRISKIFAMHEMKSNKAARSCAGITRS